MTTADDLIKIQHVLTLFAIFSCSEFRRLEPEERVSRITSLF